MIEKPYVVCIPTCPKALYDLKSIFSDLHWLKQKELFGRKSERKPTILFDQPLLD